MASARQGGQRTEVGGQNFGLRIAPARLALLAWRAGISDFSIEDCVTVRHPGQVSQSGTRAGIQEKLDYIQISLDSGSRPRSGLVRNDDFYGFYDFYDLTNSLIL